MYPDQETSKKIFINMVKIRSFEEAVENLFAQGKAWGTGHLYIGQEAIAAGAVAALEPEDYITSTHRGHGHCIAKGASLDRMMAEFMGKATGYCRGVGGSMHIADVDSGNLGANGVVGGGVPLAVGAALAIRLRKEKRLTLCFLGDGALNQGSVHEAFNMAAVMRLPVLFLVENNQYAMSTSNQKSFAIVKLEERGAGYGIPAVTIDGNDFIEVYRTVKEWAEKVREESYPALIVAETYRWKGHSKSDANRYRTREEIKRWRQKCPLKRAKEYLKDHKIMTEEEIMRVYQEVKEEIEKALKFGEESPVISLDELKNSLYA